MASVLSGPFSVRAGSAIGGARAAGGALPMLPRRLSDGERRRMAVDLRRDGWSYQRIADTLQMRYSLVAAIADGDTDPVPDEPQAPVRRSVPMAAEPATITVAGDREEMARKLDDLIAAVERQREALARLETSLPQAIEAAHDTLFDRLTKSFKTIVGRMLPGAAERKQTRSSGDEPA
jgi:hypothetical protein